MLFFSAGTIAFLDEEMSAQDRQLSNVALSVKTEQHVDAVQSRQSSYSARVAELEALADVVERLPSEVDEALAMAVNTIEPSDRMQLELVCLSE
jgi:hypothetical protein